MQQNITEYNVLIIHFNDKKISKYNILPPLKEEYIKIRKRPKTFEEFRKFIKSYSLNQWWARCEYEIVVKSWPNQEFEKKIDIYYQIMINIDVITTTFMKYIKNNL